MSKHKRTKKKKVGYMTIQGLFGKEIEIPEKWEVTDLSNVCKIRESNKTKSNLYVGLEHIGQNNNQLIERGNITEFTSSKNPFHKNDVLYGKLRPLLNKVWLATEDGFSSTDILPLQTNEKIISIMLLLILTDSRFFWYAVSTSAGTKMPRTNWSDIQKFKVFLPQINEQQKIASILSGVDALMQNTEQIIKDTERLKNGLMQKLLTKGIGHDTFKKVKWYFGKKIKIPEEWKITTLEKSCVKKKGSFSMGPFGSDIKISNFVSKGVPVIRGINLTVPPFYEHGFVFLTEEKADELKNSNVFSGDLIFTHRGTLGQVGIIPCNAKYKKYVISQSQMKCTCDKNILLPEFAFLFFSSVQGQKIINIHSTKFGVPHIVEPLTSLRKFLILLPPVNEQQKIASILSGVDANIQNHKQYKEKLERLKKSLMQKLLTGQIRVKI